MPRTQMLRDQVDAIGVGVGKVGVYGGGAFAFLAGMTAHEIAAYSGIVGMVIGLLLQLYFNRRRDRRETLQHDRGAQLDAERSARETEFHAVRMARLRNGEAAE